MITVTFIDQAGERRDRSVRPGMSLMEAARQNDIPGIIAECGGVCACATCHVYVDPDWAARVGPAGTNESAMLEFTADRRETSRLSCQIILGAALDGLVVQTPASQH